MVSCIICVAEGLHAQNVLHCCCHVKQKLPLCVVLLHMHDCKYKVEN